MRPRALITSTLVLSLLPACQPAKSTNEQSAASSNEAATPTPKATPTRVDQPTENPPSKAPPSEWWCLCYSSETDGKAQPSSACRQVEDQCRALEKRVAKGGRSIVANSLTHGCRKLSAEHPGDLTGGRELWKPSKVAGAWTSDGACLLPGDPDVVAPNTTDGEQQDPFALLASEALGELRLGMAASELVELLGEPAEKGEVWEEGATGEFVQAWNYPDRGLQLSMRANTADGAQSLGAIQAQAPCDLKTKRGVAIGSKRTDVEKAYGDVQDKESAEFGDGSSFVAGSIYGGVIFRFEGDDVAGIFMGAAAE